MELGTVLGPNNLKAFWYGQNCWHAVPMPHLQANNSSTHGGMAPQLFSPLIIHLEFRQLNGFCRAWSCVACPECQPCIPVRSTGRYVREGLQRENHT